MHLKVFYLHKIVLTSVIEKMYRKMLVCNEDTQFQRICLVFNTSGPLCVARSIGIESNTITHGTSCTPFLALRTIQQLLLDEEDNFPTAVKVAQNHMYVGDFVGESDSADSEQALVTEQQNLFKSGVLRLRKWMYNCSYAISLLPNSLEAPKFLIVLTKIFF